MGESCHVIGIASKENNWPRPGQGDNRDERVEGILGTGQPQSTK
jgi:hypothetical protein